MTDGTEQRTTRDGLPIFGGRTIRTGSFRRILEGIQRLDASLDRAVKRAEDARAKREKLTAQARPLTLRERILGTDE